MKVILKKEYYSRSKRGREPIKYHAKQPKGVGTDVFAIVRLDPILRKHKDLQKVLLHHERNELQEWGKGSRGSHSKARRKEPRLTRSIGGVSGFWKEIERRERK